MESAIATAISTTTTAVTNILTTNLPVVFTVFGGLVGLGIAVRLFKKFVGRKAA